MTVTSSLALVDLAGSEQLKQSRAVGQQRNEAVAINSSLIVLGKVIRALSEGQRRILPRCKLTKLLRGAFGGASRTTAIVTCSSDDAHADNTVWSPPKRAVQHGDEHAQRRPRLSRRAVATVDGALAQTEGRRSGRTRGARADGAAGVFDVEGAARIAEHAAAAARRVSTRTRIVMRECCDVCAFDLKATALRKGDGRRV